MSSAPCRWPGCRERARFRAMTHQDRGDRNRLTYFSLRCPSGHHLTDCMADTPNHVLAFLRGREIRGER